MCEKCHTATAVALAFDSKTRAWYNVGHKPLWLTLVPGWGLKVRED
jgi:hypothetical protein